jgi:general secretion pathway protein J
MTTPRAGAHPAQAGFTLLEVLVVLVVFGFLLLALTQGVRTGLALRRAQANHLAATADLDSTMRVLRNILTGLPIVPSGDRLLVTASGVGLKGEANRLSFVGDLPRGLGTTRLADMTLYVSEDQLILSWTPHLHARPLGEPPVPTRTALLAGVKQLQLGYWGSPAQGDEAGWHSRWVGQQAPDLIRVRLVFVQGDRRRWPDLIAASRLR